MAPNEETRKNLGKKLLKKRRDPSQPPLELPARFKDGDDAQEDVTAPKGQNAQYMNQSVFSMIAAAGSKVDFNARFDDDSSDSDGENPKDRSSLGALSASVADPSAVRKHGHTSHRKRASEHKMLKSLPKLNLRTIRERNYMSQSTRFQSAPEDSSAPKIGATPRDAPLMSQLIEAQAQLDPSSLSTEIQEAAQREELAEENEQHEYSALSRRLMEIFDLDKPERVISEYPCWLLKSVLLQGFMYITSRHVCFYAYLPKKNHANAKSGYLSKRGKQNPKYNRYWFTLKGDVLSYYLDPSDLYFPSGHIDLRYSIQASLVTSKEKGKDSKEFTVTTHQRTYYFKADSVSSAKEWVRILQKVIFRSHNDGDSVKISIPMANIIDIEDSPVLGFADTFKIRAVDNDDTFAVDEYFFSFFSFGKDALNILKIMIEDTPAQHIPTDLLHPDSAVESPGSSKHQSQGASRGQSPRAALAPVLKETVKATLSTAPLSPLSSGRNSPRPSSDFGRSSIDIPRRSLDIDRQQRHSSVDRGRRSRSKASLGIAKERQFSKSPLPMLRKSSDSFVHSIGHDPDSTTTLQSITDTEGSPSQILERSDVFQTPTINKLRESSMRDNMSRRHSEDSRAHTASTAAIRIQPPSRSQTQTSSPKPDSRVRSRHHAESDSDSNKGKLQESNSSPSLQDLVKAGSYPLQRAAGFAGYLKKNSKRMSNMLANESMGYFEKVSGMWAGGRKHYDSASSPAAEPWEDQDDDEEETLEHNGRFRAHFGLSENEHLEASFFGYLHRVLPLYGKIYISNRSFCFRSLLPGTRTKMILPLKDIENVYKEKGFRFGYSGLVLVIRAYEELFFEFSASELRDDCAITLLRNLENKKFMKESGHLTLEEKKNVETAKAEHQMLQEARRLSHTGLDPRLPQTVDVNTQDATDAPPVLFDDPRASIINFKPTESLRITCLTIGSRGDVQPYIALCKGLLKEGHKPKIATHAEFEPWVRKHGIDFASVDGDPAELMRICVENGMFTYSFLKEASQKFRGWIDELLSSAWKACQNTDILIESPSAMAGIHIAEALEIPYFRAFTMPWTRTRAYPHAFAVPDHKMGGAYNYFTYIMFDNVFWKAISGQVNRWRRKELGIRDTNLDKMQPNKVPFLYNFSPSVVVPPLDYSDWIRVTGYWFLDEASDWKPSKELTDFIALARKDKKKIVYVGFGSIVVSDPAALTRTVVESVEKADVRCILSKGWSDRLGSKEAAETEVALPSSILQIKSAPHDWLFKQIDAAAHHGGAGTTGASLRAGIPTIIKPFFGDQFFFGSRVEDLGVGIYIKKLNVSLFSKALWEACNSQRIIVKAKFLGEQIRAEDGVDTAIQAIYRDLEYAKTLIKKKGVVFEEGFDESEESWTFIGDDADPELTRKIAEWEPPSRSNAGSQLISSEQMGESLRC